MTFANTLRGILEHAEKTWSPEDQEELAAYAREIEGRRIGMYILSPEEEAAVDEGLAQADRGEFVDEETHKADLRRYGLLND